MAKKKEQELEGVELDEASESEPRVYELGFHIDPELSSEEVKKVYQGIREVISKNGEIVAEGEPENIQLAYTISRSEKGGRRDWNTAFFAWIAYEAKGEGHAKVLEHAGEETRLIRFIDVRTDRDAAMHMAELQLIRAQTPKVEEPVSDVELDAAVETAAAIS